jgi:hypothetical protein
MMMPLGEIPRQKEFIYDTLGIDGKVFFRPNDNEKSFAGEVVHFDSFDKWYSLANIYDPGKSCLSVAAQVESIHSEYRVMVADQEFLTGSRYRLKGEVHLDSAVPQEVSDFAVMLSRIAEEKFPELPCLICFDIGVTDRGPKLIEISSANTSGLYESDMKAFVDVANRIAEREWRDLYEI